MDNLLRIKMFGPFSIGREGEAAESLQELRAHKVATKLLALLALYHDRPLEKGEAALLLYGPGASEDNLNKAIQALSKALGPDGWRISSVSRTVRLELKGVEVDLLTFERAWQQRTQDLSALKDAVDFCVGLLLQGWDDPWVEEVRRQVAEKRRQSLHLLARHALSTRKLQEAHHFLRRLRLAGDCADSLHTLLMEAWMALKAYPSAKPFYEEYRDYLRREHGILPSKKMTQMYHAIPRIEARFEPPVESCLLEMEAPGGAMSVGSPYYIERPVDREFHAALSRRDGTILINGPRQVGKSSLLARGIEQGRQDGLRVVVTDFQKLDSDSLASIDTFYRALLRGFQRRLALTMRPYDYWDAYLSPNENFEGYLQDIVLTEGAPPLLWCIDEADRIFDRDYRGSVFGLFRSWHNARAEGPGSIWSRFVQILTYSTEAHLFIPDLHQSPFNVGTKLTLEDFTLDQIRELNARHDSPLDSEEETVRLFALVGGHPYLIRLCLYAMKARGLGVQVLEAEADQDVGLFRDHLERLYRAITQDADLSAGVRSLLCGSPPLSQMTFVRLRSAGVVTGRSAATARLRCGLYERYFARTYHE